MDRLARIGAVLERIAERHEALAQTVEILGHTASASSTWRAKVRAIRQLSNG